MSKYPDIVFHHNDREESAAALKARNFSKIQVGDIEMAYKVSGPLDAPKRIVLIQGLGMRGDAWLDAVQRILANSSDKVVLVFDNRGMGETTVTPGRYTTSMMAADADGLINAIGWGDRPYHLNGISMGGMIAQELALRDPSRIASLTLWCTHNGQWPHSLPPFKGAMIMMHSTKIKEYEAATEHIIDCLLGPVTRADPVKTKELYSLLLQRLCTYGRAVPAAFFSQLKAVNTHRVTAHRLQRIKEAGVPTLAFTGDADLLVKPQCSDVLAKLTGGEAMYLPGHGHVLPLEVPELCCKIICSMADGVIPHPEGTIHRVHKGIAVV